MTTSDDGQRPPVGPRAAWRVLRTRDFGPYFVGSAFSSSGTWFHGLAASLLEEPFASAKSPANCFAFASIGRRSHRSTSCAALLLHYSLLRESFSRLA